MNVKLLKYEMARNGFTAKSMCKALGMSLHTFYLKLRGVSEFRLSEILKIADLLKLQSLDPIFFSSDVS